MSLFVAPPPNLLMQISNTPSVDDFRGSFPNVRNDVRAYLREAGLEFSDFGNILDFGCGVGRFLFAFSEELKPNQKLFGCDLNRDCAYWCKENISFAAVEHTNIRPPLPYADSSMDLIYALSVFTHLTLEMQFAWAREMHRVLKPGGVIMFTTHSMSWLSIPLSMLTHFPHRQFVTLGEEGLFSAFSTEADEGVEGQREVASGHSRTAISEIFSPLSALYHQHVSRMAGGQSMTIMQKPKSAELIRQPLEIEVLGSTSSIKFKGSENTRFRGYIKVSSMVHGTQEAPIPYEATGGKRASGVVKVGIATISGESNLIPIDFVVPKKTTRVDLDFSALANFEAIAFPMLYSV